MHAAPALPELQHRFLAALYDDGESGPVEAIVGHGLDPSARLRIYRNSCNEIQTGALRATYPAVLALLGAAFYEQTARVYRQAHPSTSGNLQGFGADFAEHLDALPSLDGFAYIPDVARLEWRRQLAALADDAEPVPVDVVARQLASTEGPLELALHPSVRVVASRHPVLTIWRYAMDPTPEGLQLSGTGEDVVLWREDGEVAMATPDTASFTCIQTWLHGDPLSAAYAAAIAIDPDFDLPVCLGSLAARGLIVALHPAAPREEPVS
ncbi:MAG: HvfC/BufC family peptide modification chaperone [Rhodanobacteraceae bacterium]